MKQQNWLMIGVVLVAMAVPGSLPNTYAEGPIEKCVVKDDEANPNPDPIPDPKETIGCVVQNWCPGPNIVKYGEEQDFWNEAFYPPLGIENGQFNNRLGAFLLIPPPPRMDPNYVYYALLAGLADVPCEVTCWPDCNAPVCDLPLDEVFEDLREKAEQNDVVRIALHASLNGNYNATVDEMQDYWQEYGPQC